MRNMLKDDMQNYVSWDPCTFFIPALFFVFTSPDSSNSANASNLNTCGFRIPIISWKNGAYQAGKGAISIPNLGAVFFLKVPPTFSTSPSHWGLLHTGAAKPSRQEDWSNDSGDGKAMDVDGVFVSTCIKKKQPQITSNTIEKVQRPQWLIMFRPYFVLNHTSL